jgi:diguanylate cyclase (GGDEF)-like protein/PAS domain S-box-containing protein
LIVNSLLKANSAWHNMLRVLPVDDIVVADDRGAVCHVGENVAVLTGFSVDELINQPVNEVLTSCSDGAFQFWEEASPEDPAALSALTLVPFTLVTRAATPAHVEGIGPAITLSGRRWTIVQIARLGSNSPDSQEISGTRHELNASQMTSAAVLAESEERFRHSFGDNMAPMMMTDVDDRIIAVNDAFCSMIGWTRDALLHCDSTPFTFPEDIGISEVTNQRLTSDQVKQARYVKRYLHKDGRVIIVEISKSAAYDANGEFLYFVISERDITEERALSAQLTHQALHDPLTGLANRAVFEDRLHQAQARVLRHGGFNAVLLMDLDDFKGVNDTHGHVMGDQLLMAVSKRLEEETRSSDTLCRFGGDEFLYLAEGLTSPDEAETLAVRLRDVIARPVQVAGAQFEVRASIGIVVWNGKDIDDTQIIQNADSAMY